MWEIHCRQVWGWLSVFVLKKVHCCQKRDWLYFLVKVTAARREADCMYCLVEEETLLADDRCLNYLAEDVSVLFHHSLSVCKG